MVIAHTSEHYLFKLIKSHPFLPHSCPTVLFNYLQCIIYKSSKIVIIVCKTGDLPMAAPFTFTFIRASVLHICFHPIDEVLDFLVSILNVANNGLFNDSKWSIEDIQDFRQVGATNECWKYFYPIDYRIIFMQLHQNFLILPLIAWQNIGLKIQLPYFRG